MRKFKIFLFIEACLLTGALILMVSEHFSRFLLILFLFLLLLDARVGRVYDAFRNDSYFVFGICKEVT